MSEVTGTKVVKYTLNIQFLRLKTTGGKEHLASGTHGTLIFHWFCDIFQIIPRGDPSYEKKFG